MVIKRQLFIKNISFLGVASVPAVINIISLKRPNGASQILNQLTSISFQINPQNQFPPSGKLLITFPPEFQVTSSVAC